MGRHEITDEQYARIERLLPGKATDRGVTAKDNRQFINAVLWIDRVGGPWRDLPERFGNWNSVFRRFRRWAKKGVWKRVFEELQDTDFEWVKPRGSTSVRAHQHAAGQKSTAEADRVARTMALGRSRGGFTTKLHVMTDALGNSIRFVLTPGQRSDVTQAEALLAGEQPGAVIADRGYDADWLIEHIEALGAEAVIPPKRNRRKPLREYNRNLYADRNKVERFIGRIKQYRRVATRYEKTASSYLAMVQVAAIMTLLL